MKSIELLSPAKNLDCGLAAINHGADAVYIGAPKFGARASAANSIQDIKQLINYAHQFNARVYVALNTIIADEELDEAEKIIHQLYEIGTDALIIQDMGVLQMNIPPIALHASTQTDNRTVEKVQFLEKAGFSQVVLARELTLEQIKTISSQTSVPLEFFVQGALCVSYSGRCYISQAMCGRSANRGECAQYCRLPYDLVDANGQVLIKNKHLLSLQDLNLSDYLGDLLEAGIRSFKIEGRLKEQDYVKNVTAFYRKKLDAIFEGTSQYKKLSSGKTTFFFTPNLSKTFQRGASSYFLNGRNSNITSFDTPKSTGERIGRVQEITNTFIRLDSDVQLHNGDGLCFFGANGFTGFRINRAEGVLIYPAQMPPVKKRTEIFRNYDSEFDKLLNKKSAERKIAVNCRFSETKTGFLLELVDEDANQVTVACTIDKQKAQQAEKALETIRTQLSKLGNTNFVVTRIDLDLTSAYFIPASYLSEWRRMAIEKLEQARSESHKVITMPIKPTNHIYPQKELTYLDNVHNNLARAFYEQHGVEKIALSFENAMPKNVPLMFTKHCLKYSLGACARYPNQSALKYIFTEPLYLSFQENKLRLQFDCIHCEMIISK
ncbi:MAG: U32 family peptidase [Paludibacteraceae bacterium]|nr:U32 family peptidase [Paludibacteraceae bacterium]MBN2787924.1 U32 family peptidase [Paludibacteraceae bacterium]